MYCRCFQCNTDVFNVIQMFFNVIQMFSMYCRCFQCNTDVFNVLLLFSMFCRFFNLLQMFSMYCRYFQRIANVFNVLQLDIFNILKKHKHKKALLPVYINLMIGAIASGTKFAGISIIPSTSLPSFSKYIFFL